MAETPSAVGNEPAHQTAPSQHNGVGRRRKLVSLELPRAMVSIPNLAHGHQARWVNVDDLMPVPSSESAELAEAHSDPALMPHGRGETLPSYDFDLIELSFCLSLADYALRWAHLPTQACVKNTSVTLLSERGELPYKLQLLAAADIGKGASCLIPCGGSLMVSSAPGAIEARDGHEVLYPSMIRSVPLTVRTLAKGSQPTDTKLSVVSPLYEGKQRKNREMCLKNNAPFWALLQSPGGFSCHNI